MEKKERNRHHLMVRLEPELDKMITELASEMTIRYSIPVSKNDLINQAILRILKQVGKID